VEEEVDHARRKEAEHQRQTDAAKRRQRLAERAQGIDPAGDSDLEPRRDTKVRQRPVVTRSETTPVCFQICAGQDNSGQKSGQTHQQDTSSCDL
jgi:sRNA-binding protein